MRALELAAGLNRRHKAVLFVTLFVAGFVLVTGGGLGVGLGCVLLGIALALAVGSNSRVAHGLFIASGLLLLLTPPLFSWNESRKQQAAYGDALAKLSNEALPQSGGKTDASSMANPNDKVQVIAPDGSLGTVPKSKLAIAQARGYKLHTPVQDGDDKIQVTLPDGSTWNVPKSKLAQAQARGAKLMPNGDNLPPPVTDGEAYGPPPFALRDVIAKNWGTEAAGLALFAIGIGLLVGVKPASAQK